ncbi:MAG: hypothetical protein JWM58_450 [Rhizobium sp.]|nr:hypothetical protein [Rhizobium sp.]
MALPVTALYASILAIAAIVLSIIVSTKRGKAGVAIMDGGNIDLALWIRKHGNFAENVPFAILLMGLAEARGMPVIWLNAIGILLLAARLIHVIGLKADKPADPLRVAGAVGTHLSMLGVVVFLLWSLR